MPFAPSSFLLLVVRPGAPSSVLAPSSDVPVCPAGQVPFLVHLMVHLRFVTFHDRHDAVIVLKLFAPGGNEDIIDTWMCVLFLKNQLLIACNILALDQHSGPLSG